MNALESRMQSNNLAESILKGDMAQEVFFHIFGFLNERELTSARLVCRTWKNFADDDCLWKPFLIKLKGDRFSTNLTFNQRNFLFFDKIVTKKFKDILAAYSPKENTGREKKDLLENVESIAMESLDSLPVVCLNSKDGLVTPYCRLSEKSKLALLESSCLDWTKWQKAVETVATEIFNFDFPQSVQLNLTECPEIENLLLEKFKNPDEKMKLLINTYQIVDIFKLKNGNSIILANNGNRLNPTILLDVIQEDCELATFVNRQLISDFYSSIVIEEMDDGSLILQCSNRILDQISERLKDPNLGMKKDFEDSFTTVDDFVVAFCKNVFEI